MSIRILSVSELNNYIKLIIDNDPILNAIRVEGEISNFKLHSSGHAYFSIKDETSKVNCVMFSNNFNKIDFIPKDGNFVEIFGRISVYEKNGTYQIYVQKMENSGLGILYKNFLKIKEKLEKEGLFSEEHKKLIVDFPNKIAVITSATGAAIHDILSVLKRRNPFLEVIIIPSAVQGDYTVSEVLYAFDKLSLMDSIDAIILTRGGGSYDELFNFNDEAIARKIFECNVPVISAIGHEVDFTISDYVADLRAPTPSSAAELVTKDVYESVKNNKAKIYKMEVQITNKIIDYKRKFKEFDSKKVLFHIEKKILDFDYMYDKLKVKLQNEILGKLENYANALNLQIEKINGNNPLNILERGYSRLTDETGKRVFSAKKVFEDQNIVNELKDGTIFSTVRKVVFDSEKD